jgi:hypothetical protein
MSFNKKITIVIVIYDSTNLILNCLSQLSNFNIIIVDNKNNIKIIEELKSYKNISIISKNKNLCYLIKNFLKKLVVSQKNIFSFGKRLIFAENLEKRGTL